MSRAPLALALAFALGGTGGVARGEPAESERLRALSMEHPEDLDLRVALARALEREGALELAERELTALCNHRMPAPWADLGRVRFRLGRSQAAVEALERALADRPGDGRSRLYYGLALRALGRLEESDRALEEAGRLSSGLAPESTLVRALNQYSRGARGEGDALLRHVIEHAPASPSAREASALLGGAPQGVIDPPRLELSGWTGLEHDSNVTLEGQGLASNSDRSDSRLVFGAAVAARVLERERTSLSLGYRYGESAHKRLQEFDLRSHVFFATGRWDAGARTRLRLDALGTDAHLDNQRYLRGWTLRPNLLREIGPRAGISRLFGEMERGHFHDEPLLSPLEQSGVRYAAGLEQYVPVPRIDSGVLAIGARVEKVDTAASRLGLSQMGAPSRTFAGDFDRRGAEASARLRFPVPFRLEAELSGSFGYGRYLHRNLVDFSFPDGSVDRRRDREIGLGAALERRLTRHVSVELRWTYLDQRSNVDPYTYDRHIVGLMVKAATF